MYLTIPLPLITPSQSSRTKAGAYIFSA